ncbi:MAG: replication protein, partial [Nitrospira sp.]|nr:replication protein [Nitrospira sp.]
QKSASPQLEDGYTRLANELLEAMARHRLPGEVRQIIDVILRLTYGYQKKTASITLSQFSLATGLKKPNIVRALNRAINSKIVIKTDNGKSVSYCFQKDYTIWKSLSKKITTMRI